MEEHDEIARAVAKAQFDLAPASIREWMQEFRRTLEYINGQQATLQTTLDKLSVVVEDLTKNRQVETATCPFNSANPNYEDGTKIIDRIKLLETNLIKLSKVEASQVAIEIRQAKQDGAIALIRWIGYPALAAIFVLAVKAAFFSP